ncbi:MAG: cysteine peptidase family C39 domain-containing protein [Lacunisphaera sp.]
MRSFQQRDLTDCGAACFAFVCDHYRLRLPIARLRRELGTNQAGTTAAGLVQAAKHFGFTAKGVKGPASALPTVPLPAIVHCLVDGRLMHYVVLVRWTPKAAHVMDPAVGRVAKWSHAKFEAAWTGVLILLAPGESFAAADRTVSPVRRLWQLLQPHRAVLLQAFVGAVVTTILGLGMSIYVQKIVDSVIPDGNRAMLNLLGVAMLAILGFRLLLGWIQTLLSLRLAQRIDANADPRVLPPPDAAAAAVFRHDAGGRDHLARRGCGEDPQFPQRLAAGPGAQSAHPRVLVRRDVSLVVETRFAGRSRSCPRTA